ncbi:MAG: rRNA large subunit methyltransferase [Methanoregula sp. PtaU1.Bin051]|nr:MAG: rRNA large subunit methyltransferase [Methanoregula sp. PtaU1.Bin051]
MHIQIITVGKIRERYLADGIAQYMKRFRPYVKLRILEVDDDRRPVNLSDAQLEQILAREGEKILDAIPIGAFTIALAVDGKLYSSEDLAALMKKREISGGTVAFIIGGDLGLSRSVLERCDLRLSLSPMTFTHQMARLILLEQVYRAFRINRGEPYHK